MIYIRKHSKILIVVSIFLVSIAIGLNQSKLLDAFTHKENRAIDADILEQFKELKNIKKATVTIYAEDFTNNMKSLEQLVEDNDAEILLSKRKTKTYVALIEVANSKTEIVLEGLRNISVLKSENVRTSEPKVSVNIEERIENYLLQKKHIKNLISETTLPDRLEQLYRQLNSIQVSLDSLKTLKEEGIEHSENDIILLEIIGGSEDENSISYTVGNFFKITIIAILLLSLVFVILFLVMALLMWVMRKLGIKTSRSGSGYYGKYNYNNRKVKRIYKDKSDKEE